MLKYVLRRLGETIPTTIGILLLTFVLFNVVGGSPAEVVLGKNAFDELFIDRPYDTNGSGAYRWAKALRRLANCEPERVTAILKEAIGC